MKKILPLLGVALLLTSCENPERTADQVKKDIEAYRAKPSAETQAVVERDFVKLDQEIANLEKKADSTNDPKLSERVNKLEARRSDLDIDFKAAKMGKVVDDIKNTVKDIGNSIKNLGDSLNKQIQSTDTNQ